ncbi:MAG: hypothetical protein WC397_03320 [Candidatus Paceibacterota bacterium]|jgi:hypothetical protein
MAEARMARVRDDGLRNGIRFGILVIMLELEDRMSKVENRYDILLSTLEHRHSTLEYRHSNIKSILPLPPKKEKPLKVEERITSGIHPKTRQYLADIRLSLANFPVFANINNCK